MTGIPVISVCIITYNHSSFIKDAIDGVVMQKLDYSLELIIADDCSTDGTREILLGYYERFPKIIRLILQKKNVGPSRNWEDLIKAARGKYIAYFEGDDFWTDQYKLRRQIDFLEENPDFAICFHNARILNVNEPEVITYSNTPDQREISGFEDLARGEFIYTATCIFRNEHFRKFPEKYYSFMNNYTLDLHNAQYGKIKYMNEVMCVYRVHNGGIWSMVAREKTLMSQLPAYKFYLGYFDKKYRHFFVKHLRNMTIELVSIIIAKNDYKNFWRYYKEFVLYNLTNRQMMKKMVYFFFKANFDRMKQKIQGNA